MARLWPKDIPIIGVTGEKGSGKTCFGLSISPDPKRTLVYDLEMSADPYKGLGFEHVNVSRELAKKHPNGCKAIDLWKWWLDSVKALPPDKFDVILVDPITDLEAGLVDWVAANPGYFGHTSNQYDRASGIMWGDVKAFEKLVLTTIVAAKCQTFVFTAHLGAEFVGGKPTDQKKAKGKETLFELASLYLWMERKKVGQLRTGVPSATVMKERLGEMRLGPGGLEVVAALPPKLPEATPNAIRRYLLNPPDFAKLSADEQVQEKVLTADERLRLETSKAEAEASAEAARTERAKLDAAAAAAKAVADGFAAEINKAGDEAALADVQKRISAAVTGGEVDDTGRQRLMKLFNDRKKAVTTATK